MKKFICAFLVLTIVFCSVMTGCGKKEDETNTTIATQGTTKKTEQLPTPQATTPQTTVPQTTAPQATQAPQPQEYPYSDPATWNVEQIVDFYRRAAYATESAGCQSRQIMSLESLNGGDGFVGTVINAFESAGKSAIERNNKTIPGLTGGYENLTATDLQGANAVRNGNYVIINMYPQQQVDGIYGSADAGTVGHVVSVLDGIKTAIDEIGIPADCPDGSATLVYSDSYAQNIVINTTTGKIESGTWGYVVNVSINGISALGITLNNANLAIRYTVVYPA